VEFIAVADPGRYTVHFGEGGEAAIRFDCNRGGGNYEMARGSIRFGNLYSTRMACLPGSQDTVFMRQLEAARLFFVEGGMLYLDLFADSGTMRFEPVSGK
jgi:heat shock protein HslJ